MKASGRGTVTQTTKEELLTPLKTQKYVRNQVMQRPAKIFHENYVYWVSEAPMLSEVSYNSHFIVTSLYR